MYLGADNLEMHADLTDPCTICMHVQTSQNNTEPQHSCSYIYVERTSSNPRSIYAIFMYWSIHTQAHRSVNHDTIDDQRSCPREKIWGVDRSGAERALWVVKEGDASGIRQGEECCVHGLPDDKGKRPIGRRHSRYSENTSCRSLLQEKITVVAQRIEALLLLRILSGIHGRALVARRSSWIRTRSDGLGSTWAVILFQEALLVNSID
jgi:hypothetical protein